MTTPYTTPRTATAGAVQIGLRYMPKMPAIYGDALKLQSALIEPRTIGPQNWIQRAIGAFWRWL